MSLMSSINHPANVKACEIARAPSRARRDAAYAFKGEFWARDEIQKIHRQISSELCRAIREDGPEATVPMIPDLEFAQDLLDLLREWMSEHGRILYERTIVAWAGKGILMAPYSKEGEEVTIRAGRYREGYVCEAPGSYLRKVKLGRCVDAEKFHFEVIWRC